MVFYLYCANKIMERQVMEEKHVVKETDDVACSVRVIHEDIVARVARDMPEKTMLEGLAFFFKVFGDPTRIAILMALSKEEMCVCDLCALLDMKQSAVSHQLKTLKQSRIVRRRREGKVMYYSLDDNHIDSVLRIGIQHIREETQEYRLT